MHPKSLIHIIHLDDYHSDLLVVSVVFHFGYMPVAREEDKEFIGITVIESCFLYLVIIVYHVWSVLAVGYPKAVKAVAESGVKNVLYISCNPVTLATELKTFTQYYNLVGVEAFDFFPHSEHIETLVQMELK